MGNACQLQTWPYVMHVAQGEIPVKSYDHEPNTYSVDFRLYSNFLGPQSSIENKWYRVPKVRTNPSPPQVHVKHKRSKRIWCGNKMCYSK
jgi:hypothetical protein